MTKSNSLSVWLLFTECAMLISINIFLGLPFHKAINIMHRLSNSGSRKTEEQH